MIAWVLAAFASPLGRKIALGAGIAAVFGMGLRYWGNRQWSQGVEHGKSGISADLEKAVQAARDEERARLQAERDALAQQSKALESDRAQLARDRMAADGQVRDRLASIEDSLRNDNTRVVQTPDSGLSDLVRALNADLRIARPAEPGRTPGDGSKSGGTEGGAGADQKP